MKKYGYITVGSSVPAMPATPSIAAAPNLNNGSYGRRSRSGRTAETLAQQRCVNNDMNRSHNNPCYRSGANFLHPHFAFMLVWTSLKSIWAGSIPGKISDSFILYRMFCLNIIPRRTTAYFSLYLARASGEILDHSSVR